MRYDSRGYALRGNRYNDRAREFVLFARNATLVFLIAAGLSFLAITLVVLLMWWGTWLHQLIGGG